MIRRQRHITQRPDYFALDPCHDLAQGLVFAGFGRFPGGYRYDDATESMFGGGNHGSLTNMDPASDWVWVPELGRFAQAFSDAKYISSVSKVGFSGSVGTFASWEKWINPTGAKQLFAYRRGSSHQIRVLGYDSNPNFFIYDSTTTIKRRLASVLGRGLTGSWVHIACTWNLGELNIFINGRLANGTLTGAGTGIFDFGLSDAWQIGGSEISAADPLIFNRALSPGEIATLADPSNVMLDGLLVAPGRHSFPSAALTASPWIYYQSLRSYL
jgi:hypothetical protein